MNRWWWWRGGGGDRMYRGKEEKGEQVGRGRGQKGCNVTRRTMNTWGEEWGRGAVWQDRGR